MSRFTTVGLAIAATALAIAIEPGVASAQWAAGQVFNQIFSVGGPGVRQSDPLGPGFQVEYQGSIGCGGTVGDGLGGGSSLKTALDTARGESVDDRAQSQAGARAQARELWRFCDNMTDTGGAWSGQAFNPADPQNIWISPQAEQQQSEGMAPDELFSGMRLATSLARVQVANVYRRLQGLRLAAHDPTQQPVLALAGGSRDEGWASGTGLRLEEEVAPFSLSDLMRTGLSGGESATGVRGLGVFVNGHYNRINADSTPAETGSVSNGAGITAGVDYFLRDDLFLGLAFGWSRLETAFDNSFGDSQLNDYAFTGYGSFFADDRFYVDATFSGSILRFEQKKIVPTFDLAAPGAAPLAPLRSKPEGWHVGAEIGTGAELPWLRLDWNPYLRAALQHTEIDQFNESGGDGSLALTIRDQKSTSVTSTLGLQLALPLGTPIGVFAPFVRAEWEHEYMDQAAQLRGYLTTIPQAVFLIQPNPVDRNYAIVGAGLGATFKRGISGFVDWDGLFGFSNLSAHKVTVGMRLEL